MPLQRNEDKVEVTRLEEFQLLIGLVRDYLPPSYSKAFEMLGELSDVMELIEGYVKKHGNIVLSCGSEWMFQDNDGQMDAIDLVGKILDRLKNYAEPEED